MSSDLIPWQGQFRIMVHVGEHNAALGSVGSVSTFKP